MSCSLHMAPFKGVKKDVKKDVKFTWPHHQLDWSVGSYTLQATWGQSLACVASSVGRPMFVNGAAGALALLAAVSNRSPHVIIISVAASHRQTALHPAIHTLRLFS